MAGAASSSSPSRLAMARVSAYKINGSHHYGLLMILTCPACSTRYLVNPSNLGRLGRVVRCAKCRHSWMQEAPDDLPRHIDVTPLEQTARPIRKGSNLPALPGQNKRRSSLPGWIALLIAVAAVGIGVVAGRDVLVEAWPPAARLYSAIGMPAEVLGQGLEFRDVNFERAEQDGRATLIVTGMVANISDKVRTVPLMRASVTSGGAKVIRDWTFSVKEERLLPGESVPFVTRLDDPPDDARELLIAFTPTP